MAPPARHAHRFGSWIVRPYDDKLFLAAGGFKTAGVLQPLRTRRQYGTKRNPLPDNDFGIQTRAGQCRECLSRFGELGLHKQQTAPMIEELPYIGAERVKDKTAVVARVPRLGRTHTGRNVRAVAWI